jgi:hypothetical protein
MRRIKTGVILLSLVAGMLVGCGRGQTPIPAGAQVVHVVATESEVSLDPSTVHAGEVYLVLDAPLDGSISFVERKSDAAETPGPLSDDDLARLAQGDTEGTAIGGLDAGGCSPEQDAEDRGQMGYCGNVMKVVVVEGKYAVLGPGWTEMETEPSADPTADPAGFHPPQSMAVLEVLP